MDADILCQALRSKGVSHYLVAWIKSFLSGRSCRLLFQGSPISPLLFVIYVSPLPISLPHGLVLLYVDDFALTTSSSSYRTNSRYLQAAFGTIRAIAHARKIDFSVPKTELIHWRTTVQRDPPGTPRPPPRCPRWPNFFPLRQTPLARLLVCPQHLLLGSLFTPPRPLTSRIRCCPPPLLGRCGYPPPPLPPPCLFSLVSDPTIRRRPLRPHQRASLQDGCSLEAGPKVGHQLLQVYPPPHSLGRVVSSATPRPLLP